MDRVLSEREIDEVLKPCLFSTAVMAVTFFKHHVTRAFCGVHNAIFELIDDDEKRLIALGAPRGFGKTTVVGLFFCARKLLFRFTPYIVYISSSQTEAAKKVKTLASELQYNPLIKELFGDVRGTKWAEEAGELELIDEKGVPFACIQAKGSGSQVRGMNWRGHRPGLFIVDDLEDKEYNLTLKHNKSCVDFIQEPYIIIDAIEIFENEVIPISTSSSSSSSTNSKKIEENEEENEENIENEIKNKVNEKTTETKEDESSQNIPLENENTLDKKEILPTGFSIRDITDFFASGTGVWVFGVIAVIIIGILVLKEIK